MEILLGVASTKTTSTLFILNPSVGIIISTCTAMLTSIAVLITNKNISKLKTRYTKFKDWINVITLLYEKTLKQSMIDKNINQKEAEELKEIYNHYLDKRTDIMKKTQPKVEDVFGDILNEDSISREQITKLNNFSAKMM